MAVMTAEAGLVQVRFKTKHPQYEVGEVPITVPLTLKRFGLSEVINHLLARGRILGVGVPLELISFVQNNRVRFSFL